MRVVDYEDDRLDVVDAGVRGYRESISVLDAEEGVGGVARARWV